MASGSDCAACNPCPHGKLKRFCVACNPLPAWQAESQLHGMQWV
jgi:hypothetical protein